VPIVSIVIPCWNAGQYLPGLFESLDAQLFRDFEAIVVDDGSTDPATLDALRTLPQGVILIRQENHGLPAARNAGFHTATGEFVLPLDCDDRIAPEFLSRGVEKLRADPAVDFVFSHMRLVGAREGLLERGFNRFDQLFLNQLPYSLLMRRPAWERVGGYDESMRQGYEDWDFNLRLIMSGSSGALLSEPLFVYRVAEGGMLLSKSARRHGELWASIRAKHPAAYRLGALLKLYRTEGAGRLSLAVALTLLSAALLLPRSWFGSLYQRVLASRARQAPVPR
jgi:glycosyltransferase involved in cell wall biosynthesis